MKNLATWKVFRPTITNYPLINQNVPPMWFSVTICTSCGIYKREEKDSDSLIRGGDDPHLHLGSGEYDKTEDVAEDPDGYDDESHHAGN